VRNNVSDSGSNNMDDDWGWRLHNKAVHPVPSFYPLDPRSTRRVHLANKEEMEMEETTTERPHSVDEVSHQISTACQSLSIHAIWDNNSSTATLRSMERVEMEITIHTDDSEFQTYLGSIYNLNYSIFSIIVHSIICA